MGSERLNMWRKRRYLMVQEPGNHGREKGPASRGVPGLDEERAFILGWVRRKHPERS